MKLLIHIAYYSNKKRVDSTKFINKETTKRILYDYEVLLKIVKNIDTYYMFDLIDIVIDMNKENEFEDKIINDTKGLTRTNVKVIKHDLTNVHPFTLTSRHRKPIEENIDNYDWFMYSEDDGLIPIETIEQQVKLSEKIYRKYNHDLGMIRVVFDNDNNNYYDDIIEPSSKDSIIDTEFGQLVYPTNGYAACWFYPKLIMKDFIKSSDWKIPKKFDFYRPLMAYGYNSKKRYILLEDLKPKNSIIWDLGASGDYYHRCPHGQHTLPFDDFIK